MNRWSLGIAAVLAVVAAQSASAQVYVYGAPAAVYVPGTVYSSQVVVTPAAVAPAYYAAPVVAGYAPAYVPAAPVVQMAYSVPVVAAPVAVGPAVRQTTRFTPHGYTQTTRAYGPTIGPRYSRVHVHSGLFGTRVRETVR